MRKLVDEQLRVERRFDLEKFCKNKRPSQLSLGHCDFRGSLLHLSPREKVARNRKDNTEEKVKLDKGQPRQWSGEYFEERLGVQRPG